MHRGHDFWSSPFGAMLREWQQGPPGSGPGPRRGGPWGWEPPRAERPRAARGDLRLAVLALLREGPRHGYQLIRDIEGRSGGGWRPSPGSIYPTLAAMQDEGLVDDEKVEGRRVYALTDAGRDYVSDREDEVLGAFDAFVRDEREHGAAGSSGIEDYGRLMFGVGAAAVQVARAGTPEQLEQARRILEGTRRQLYRVLSEEHDDE